MKIIITILLFFCIRTALGTNYYVSISSGNDANNGTSPSTPWQTIDKVNSFNFNAGDHIYFSRGEVFYGGIVASTAGIAGNPVVYSSYGNGGDPNPVVIGLLNVTGGWTNMGGNIWQSIGAVSTLSKLNTVLINGKSVPMGRYPNGDGIYPYLPNFYKFQSITGDGTGASSITSSSLSGGTDWTGADVVIRVNQWSFHREVITSQSGSTLNFNGATGGLVAGWGFFIQNDIRTLDQQGEWYYDPSSKKISIYSVGVPTDVKVGTVDRLFYFYSNSPTTKYVSIDHVDFKGANTNNIWIEGNTSCSIVNSNVSYAGLEGLLLNGGGIINSTVNNCSFYGNGSSGIFSTGDVSNTTITNNTVNVSGIVSVYKQNDYTNGGINLNSPSSLIQYNNVDSSAYCGINFKGANIQARNNFVNHSALVRGDAAGIYTGFAGETGKVIDKNVILNSIGNTRGSLGNDHFAFGIYSDDFGTGIQITNNFIADCRTGGIYIHNSNNETIQYNTIYNCGPIVGDQPTWATGGIAVDANAGSFAGSVHNNNTNNNTIYALLNSQHCIFYYADPAGSNGEVGNFGTLDYNAYIKVNGSSTIITSQQTGINGEMSLSSWQGLSSKDIHTVDKSATITDASLLIYRYNVTQSTSSAILDGTYQDINGNLYSGIIDIPPYSGVVLIKTGIVPPTIDIRQRVALPGNAFFKNREGTGTTGADVDRGNRRGRRVVRHFIRKRLSLPARVWLFIKRL